MLKKYKAFMNNEGKFAQPGARALQDYISTYDQHVEADRVAQAVRAAEQRVRVAEEQAREAEAHAREAEAEAHAREAEARAAVAETRSTVMVETRSTLSTDRDTITVAWDRRASTSTIPSLVSAEIVLRERLFSAPAEMESSPRSSTTVEIPERERLLCERNARSEPTSPQSVLSTESSRARREASLFLERIPRDSSRPTNPEDYYVNPAFPPREGGRAGLSPIPTLPPHRQRPARALPPLPLLKPNAEPRMVEPTPKRLLPCALCASPCAICPNPWQRTRSDLILSKPAPPPRYGLALSPCGHAFCGACLQEHIFHALNLAFDRGAYGMRLPSGLAGAFDVYAMGMGMGVAIGGVEWPVGCPTRGCDAEISDAEARRVLGKNVDEWNYARFLAGVERVRCPRGECRRWFDADGGSGSAGGRAKDKSKAKSQDESGDEETRVECPYCRESLCRVCKCVWHRGLTCLMYQALSPADQAAALVGAGPSKNDDDDVRVGDDGDEGASGWRGVKHSRRRGMTLDIPVDPPWVVEEKQRFISA
ncbi:hypothetical protein C8R46DRAFT_1357973 [Mycena filopes]|nr:hypothetical protein C8R46DRAFT_1357973 [Mycena filopes]